MVEKTIVSDRPVDLFELVPREILGAVFERSASGIVITNLDGSIIQANRAYQKMLGYTETELTSTTFQALTYPDDLEQNIALRAQLLNKSRDEYQYEKRYQRKDGSLIWVRTSVSLIEDVHGTPRLFMSVVEDITEHVNACQLLEQRVQERTREIEHRRQVAEALSDNLALLNGKAQLKEILEHIVRQACDLLNAQACAIYQLEEERQSLRIRAAHGLPASLVPRTIPIGQGEIGKAILYHAVTLNPDLRAESTKHPPANDRLGSEGMTRPTEPLHALIALPLEIKDQTYGAIALYYHEPREITDEQVQLALLIARQAALAIEGARLNEQERQFAALSERQRLARELHDSVSQALYAIELEARTARNRLEREPQRARAPLDAVLTLTNAALAEMRSVIFDLRPESLEAEGLVAALEKQIGYLRARYNLEVKTSFDVEPTISLDAKEALYRIAQEALHNIIRHAHASQVELRLHSRDRELLMEITDNGIGFDATRSFPGHLGMHTMQERVTHVGGKFRIKSMPSAGTCVSVEIPI